MYDRHWGLVVKVVHAHGYLLGPEQDLMEVDGMQSQVVVEGSRFSEFCSIMSSKGTNLMFIHPDAMHTVKCKNWLKMIHVVKTVA